MLAAFTLPFIAVSLSSGPAKFLQVMCFVVPLMVGTAISSTVFSKTSGETTT